MNRSTDKLFTVSRFILAGCFITLAALLCACGSSPAADTQTRENASTPAVQPPPVIAAREAVTPPPPAADPRFEGDGGANVHLAVLEPVGKGLRKTNST
ncbi:MAG: hypothetical protein LBT68_05000 [Spirochaetales bacterium]|nr:hypothetical protein [Spirochaetales bacterium]